MKKFLIILTLFICFKSVAQVYDTAIAVLQPLNMPSKSGLGTSLNNYWIQDSSGFVADSVTFPANRNYRFDFTGYASSYGGGLWPDIGIVIDNTLKYTFKINKNTDSIWSTVFPVGAGKHNVKITYTDLSANGSNKIHMGLLYIFSSTSAAPVTYPTIVKRSLPTYGSGFIKAEDFVSGHLRGMNGGRVIRGSSANIQTLIPQDFADLHTMGANILRCWATIEDAGSTYSFTTGVLDTLNLYVKRARANNLYLVVVITDFDNTGQVFWGNTAKKQSFIDRARDLVTLYKDSTEIAGWAMTNEPTATGTLGEFCKFAQDMASAIRKIDTNHAIIFPSFTDNGSTDVYNFSEPLAFKNVVYETHFYEPFQITHQGINVADNHRTEYPNGSFSPFYSASYFGAYNFTGMQAEIRNTRLLNFSTRNNIPVFVGEFTCVAYAPNYSSTRWIHDAITIWEQNGWAWTNTAYRQYEPWDPEIPSSKWYQYTYTNAFPNVSPSVGIMDQFRSDTAATINLLKSYWALNATPAITVFYRDADNDGYGTTSDTLMRTSTPVGYVGLSGDCDDANPDINPGEAEVCNNGIDENCNGVADEGCALYYQDSDADGYGNIDVTSTASTPPTGYVDRSGDCNDADSTINSGALEICGNGIDDNCNGQIDENCPSTPIIDFVDNVIYVRGNSVDQIDVRVKLSTSARNPVTVNYATSNGTALAGTDFRTASGTLTFSGTQRHKIISIALKRGVHSATKSFYITLSSPTGATLAPKSTCIVFLFK